MPALVDVVVIGRPEWDALLARGRDAATAVDLQAVGRTLSADDPINIQYTSGTTGFPKGATLSHHNILNNGHFVAERCDFTETDRVAVPVPLYHCFGMVMGNLGALTHGACVVYPAPGFDPSATLDAVAAERCTVLYGVPTMFISGPRARTPQRCPAVGQPGHHRTIAGLRRGKSARPSWTSTDSPRNAPAPEEEET